MTTKHNSKSQLKGRMAAETCRLAKLLRAEEQRELEEARQKEADRLAQMLAADMFPGILSPREQEKAQAEIQAQMRERRFEPTGLQKHSPRNPAEELFSLRGRYDDIAPELAYAASEGVKYRLRHFQPGADDNAKELKYAADVAMDIRAAWLGHSLELPDVPPPSHADNPTEQDFRRLEQWFLTAGTRITKAIDAGGDAGGNLGGKARMSAHDLAERFKVPENALYHRLERWRKNHDDGWQDVSNRTRNEPHILYEVQAVMPVILALQNKTKRQPNGRP